MQQHRNLKYNLNYEQNIYLFLSLPLKQQLIYDNEATLPHMGMENQLALHVLAPMFSPPLAGVPASNSTYIFFIF